MQYQCAIAIPGVEGYDDPMRGLILTLVCSLALVACALSKADRPEIRNLELVSPTMRLLFPLDDVTLTATVTRTPTITPTRTVTPIGYKSPTPTNTLVPIFPIESTDTPVYYFCMSSPGGSSNIQGVIWLDKNRDGIRQSGESGVVGQNSWTAAEGGDRPDEITQPRKDSH